MMNVNKYCMWSHKEHSRPGSYSFHRTFDCFPAVAEHVRHTFYHTTKYNSKIKSIMIYDFTCSSSRNTYMSINGRVFHRRRWMCVADVFVCIERLNAFKWLLRHSTARTILLFFKGCAPTSLTFLQNMCRWHVECLHFL